MPKKHVGTGHVVITDKSGEDAAAANHTDADIYAEDMAPLAKDTAPTKKVKLAQKGMATLMLVGAASYGCAGVIYRRDDNPIQVDSSIAERLLATGLLEVG